MHTGRKNGIIWYL